MAITLKVLENRQREHEAAQIKATNVHVDETILWRKDGGSGVVTVLRDGTSTTGWYCRDFRQDVTIGGSKERAYGTARRNSDGSWCPPPSGINAMNLYTALREPYPS